MPRETTMLTKPESSGKEAGAILKEAHDIVVGSREATHGPKERSFKIIAQFWNTYLDGRKESGPITATDVSMMMALLKIARSIQGEPVKDHFLDASAYCAIAWEVSE